MKKLLIFSLVLLFADPALADWNLGDPYKMHFPQLPDPNGWDVNATFPQVLADDWQCSETGPVSDVHLWGSWEGGQGGPDSITNIHLSIHTNILAPAGGGISMPGELLWEGDFFTGQFTVIDPDGDGVQGWYDPSTGDFRFEDHFTFHQINIVDIPDPWTQIQGEIYWLDVSVQTVDPAIRWGWKTADTNSYPAPYTGTHFEDDAVWADDPFSSITGWQELTDPEIGESLDMAFVITPEPVTLSLLLVSSLAALKRRRPA